ncbi:MAG: hypothetical protein AAB851_02200 [Patescibacteria group bacterium]|mgnify:CR=1 FL=1
MFKKIIIFSVLFGLFAGVVLAHDGHFDYAIGDEGAEEVSPAAKNAREKAKENYEKTKENYLKVRSEFKETKAKARSAEDKAKSIEKGKEMVNKMIDRMGKDLGVVKARIQNVKDLDEAEKSAIGAKIDAEIAALEALKEKVGAAQTKEELRVVLKEAKDHWHKVRRFAKHFVGRLLVHRIKKAVEKLEAFIPKIEAKIAELKAAGKDVSKLETMVADGKEHLALAKEKYQQAKDKYMTIENAADFQAIAKEANRLAKEANKHLIEAHKILKRLIPGINKIIRPAAEAEEEPGVESESSEPTGAGTETENTGTAQ